jgi:hypothetical protein
MKGNPLLRTALVLAVLLLVLIPVLRITRHASSHDAAPPATAAASPAAGVDRPAATLGVTLLVHCAPDATNCSVSQSGRILLTAKDRIAPGEYRSATEIAKGTDLVIRAEWGDGDPHALRAEVLVHGYQAPLEKSFWAAESLEDAFPIPASFLPPATP